MLSSSTPLHPSTLPDPVPPSPQGRCLFTLGPLQSSHTASAAGAPSLNSSSAEAYSWGRTGVAPTPGSTSVYDRASGSMVVCDSKSCPLATPSQQQLGDAGAQATVYVNRAPVVVRSDNGREDTRTNKVTALEAQVGLSNRGGAFGEGGSKHGSQRTGLGVQRLCM